tara:strand:+ start:2736 stop:3473 length:738 start_codon:yes stop_codon:yes gene_type:complete
VKLTTKQIKQLIKEEVKKVLLGENLFRANLEIMDQQQRREPQAWEQEINQYVTMLGEGLFEQFYMLIYDDLPMLAKILDMSHQLDDAKFDNITPQQFLGSIANMEDSGQAGQLVEDYVNNRPGTPMMHMLRRRFESVELAGNIMGLGDVYMMILSLLHSDRVFLGYLGIILVAYDSSPYLILHMHEDNLEANIKRIRDLWHGRAYGPATENSSMMLSPVNSRLGLFKFSTVDTKGRYVKLLLGIE